MGQRWRRPSRPVRALVALGLLGAALAAGPTGPAGSQTPPAPSAPSPAPSQGPSGIPDRAELGLDIADGNLRQAVADLDDGLTTEADVDVVGEQLRVEVLHHTTDAAMRRLVQEHGGTVDGSVPGVLVEGLVPADQIEALEAEPVVDVVRPPLPVAPISTEGLPGAGAFSGEEVAKTRADIWQLGGETGEGVRVGIIDAFDLNTWNVGESTGDVPNEAGTFCRIDGATCDVFALSSLHGLGVAEIIHEMAPDAELYLGAANSVSDLQALVDWFDSQGVDVVNRSQVVPYDGPGDGTGPTNAVIDNAVADGMTWVQGAGNAAGDGGVTQYGSYYRWTYADADDDGLVEFAPDEEVLQFYCGWQLGLRWSDFGEGAGATDYDMYVYDPANFVVGAEVDTSLNDQTAGAPPTERTTDCVGGWNYLVVEVIDDGATPVGDLLEFATNGTGVYPAVNPGSAAVPGADHDSPGALTVGAVDPALGTTAAVYSSQGPTNDGRAKPDISAASCVQSRAYSPQCFRGTSAATPAVAGAAALLVGSGVATTPAAVRNWLLCNAVVDRGAPGIDNIYGVGELILPSTLPPPTRVCRPDARIRTGTTGPLKGDNVYSATAGTQQTVTRSGGSGANLTYTTTFQNDGRTPERFRIQGTRSTNKFTVTYRVGGANVTNAVGAGTYQSPMVAPGASVTMSVTVKVKTNTVRGNTFTGTLTARSTVVPTIRDAVKFTARRS